MNSARIKGDVRMFYMNSFKRGFVGLLTSISPPKKAFEWQKVGYK